MLLFTDMKLSYPPLLHNEEQFQEAHRGLICILRITYLEISTQLLMISKVSCTAFELMLYAQSLAVLRYKHKHRQQLIRASTGTSRIINPQCNFAVVTSEI